MVTMFYFVALTLFLFHSVSAQGAVGDECFSIRDCSDGLVCASGNPRGSCVRFSGAMGLSHFVSNLIQEDYSSGSTHSQGGPLRTSRAMAIIYLSAHDAYAVTTGAFNPKIQSSSVSNGFSSAQASNSSLSTSEFEEQAVMGMQIAGLTAAKLLYSRLEDRIDIMINTVSKEGILPLFKDFGELVGTTWFNSRRTDGSAGRDIDNQFSVGELLQHQPDPNYPIIRGGSEGNFGRIWSRVTPFALSNVRSQASLGPFPGINSTAYRRNLAEVIERGQCNELTTSSGIPLKDIGIFWGYDSADRIGVPPRLYLQTILAIKALNNLPLRNQLRALTAVAVSMADAGIAAWLWKFEYDLWRPVIGVRNDTQNPITDWNPIGIALSNAKTTSGGNFPSCVGINPNFPAYPSGHATFGSAAFRTLARLLSSSPSDISFTFTSDEFNGRTVDGTTGRARRVLTQKLTLEQAIEQNNDGRVYLGVHWRFDSDGGDEIGSKIANVVSKQFSF